MSAPAPAATPTEPLTHHPFIVPPSLKKVLRIDQQGAEIQADDNLWARMQRTDPFVQALPEQQDAAVEADGEQKQEETVPDPRPVVNTFHTAKHELEWLQLMLRALKQGYLTVGRIERTSSQDPKQRIMELALEMNSRHRRRTKAAEAASTLLAEGAQALRALGNREDAFYLQVAQLQRYWKIKQAPPDSGYAYIVNLKLSSSSSSSSSDESLDLTEACALIGRGPVPVVPLLKDPAGMLRVQVPAQRESGPPTIMNRKPEEPPTIYTGPAAIHALLLQQLRLNAWHLVLQSLDTEITQRLGLPGRLQPSVAAAAAAAARAGSSLQQQQQQQSSEVAAAGAASEGTAAHGQTSNSSGTTGAAAEAALAATAAAAAAVQRVPSVAGGMQKLAASGVGAHFTFYATLSNLVLQAVVGSAATAGEDLILEQQQQQQSLAAAAVGTPGPQQQQQQRGSSPVDNGSLSVGSLNLELDVGGPWERAAAAGSSASLLYQPPPADSSSSSSIVLDPQLLSLRPLALQHLLLTQLGHLITKSYYQDKRPIDNAAIAFAAAAREQQHRHRQRLIASGGSSSSSSGVAVLLLPAVSFMTCLSRWLAHSSSRELVRAKIDEIVLQYPGVIAKTLSCCHSCNSANMLLPSNRASRGLAAAAAAGRSGSAATDLDRQQQQQQQVSGGVTAPVLVLMSDASIVLESAGLGLSDGSASMFGQHRRCRDVQQSVIHLVALPGVLRPLLDGMLQQ